ncbi:M23 family metallopeptidase [Candidatus Microgenomates bacterium]|nr:M23 family metallopeptidase [Candidatus Microgenomates bacterium]
MGSKEERQQNRGEKKPIGKWTTEWEPGLDVELPIKGDDIQGFSGWASWVCFGEHHLGFDFAVYIDEKGNQIEGLPKDTPVRAIADGTVVMVDNWDNFLEDPYYNFISIRHGHNEAGPSSEYIHIISLVKMGQLVKKGEVIGKVWEAEDPEERKEHPAPHLHLSLANGRVETDEPLDLGEVDPVKVFPELGKIPQFIEPDDDELTVI